MRLIITSGGSGGHIFPALSLIQALEEREGALGVLFISTARELDKRLLSELKYCCMRVAMNPPAHRPSARWITFLYLLITQTVRIYPKVRKFKPDVIVGFGGYGSLPAILAGRLLRVPIVLHEQNARPGLANRFLSRFAARIAVGFPEARAYFKKGKTVLTGNPLRQEIVKVDMDESARKFPCLNGAFRLLVMGGSQGAEKINEVFMEALPALTKECPALSIIHITGTKMAADIAGRYAEQGVRHWVFPFLKEIGLAYQASDLIISRAGALSLAEITALGKSAILIPHPRAASGQGQNAKVLRARNAALVIEENELTPQRLKENITLLIKDKALLFKLADNAKRLGMPAAAARLADVVMEVI